MKHVNIYGPAGSGKTRYAEELRKSYGCDVVVDEGKDEFRIPEKERALFLTQQPFDEALFSGRVTPVSIEEALKKIGVIDYRIFPMSHMTQVPDEAQSFYVAKYNDRRGRPGTMLLHVASGRVYYTGHRRDIRDENTDTGRAWCRLTGVRNADLVEARKEYRAEMGAIADRDRVDRIRRQAEEYGYRLEKNA